MSLAVVAVGASSYTWLVDQASVRYSDTELTSAQISQGREERFDLIRFGCRIDVIGDADRCNTDRPVQVLFLGNSHEPDGVNWWAGAAGGRIDVEFVSFGTTNRCDGLTEVEGLWITESADCQKRLDALLSESNSLSFDLIVYIANKPFASNKAGLLHLVAASAAHYQEAEVVVMGGFINTGRDCPLLMNQMGVGACSNADEVTYFEGDPTMSPLYAEFVAVADHVIDRVDLHCTNRRLETCATTSIDGVPYSWDQHHWSMAFALESGQQFARRHPALLDMLLSDRSS